MRIPAALALFALLATSPAHADSVRDALLEIAKCADIADAAERLKCFDAVVPGAKNALAAPPQKEERSILDWFGFTRPDKPVLKTEDFGKPPAPPEEPKELTEIKAAVLEFAKTPYGKALFVLDNGQVWKQLDADSSNVREAPAGIPMKVMIEVGFMGSYNLTIDGRNGLIKVSRVK